MLHGPGWERYPLDSTSGRPPSWQNSKSSGCSWTSAAGWAVYEQRKLATDIAGLQTDRAFQTVANDVAVAYYNVLRTQALRRTAKDALRRTEEELADARKRQREGVIEREAVLRAEVQPRRRDNCSHSATETEFVALAALNLAIGLQWNRGCLVESSDVPPLNLACRLLGDRGTRATRIQRDSKHGGSRGTRHPVARADLHPKSWRMARSTSGSSTMTAFDFRLGSYGSNGRSSRAAAGSRRRGGGVSSPSGHGPRRVDRR